MCNPSSVPNSSFSGMSGMASPGHGWLSVGSTFSGQGYNYGGSGMDISWDLPPFVETMKGDHLNLGTCIGDEGDGHIHDFGGQPRSLERVLKELMDDFPTLKEKLLVHEKECVRRTAAKIIRD
jgi:hypothetical protein